LPSGHIQADPFRGLVEVIVSGDSVAAIRLLNASPQLARARAAQGATRQAPEQNFFDQILQGRFERRPATQRVLGLPLHGAYPCVIY
jgi:hypothetical protein